jgi:aspartate/methionine/tyrosine aminotransferase
MPIGDDRLKTLIATKFKRDHLIDVNPERNIVITPGSDSGLLFAMIPFIGTGDEVLVHSPSYPSNFLNPSLLGGKAIPVPTHKDNNYQLEIEEYRQRLTNKTKMILLTQPNNPTTTVFRKKCLEQLAQFVIDNDLILIVDYAFEDIIYDNIEFFDITRIEGMWERTISVHSISKGMALSGFRVGYLVADDRIIDVLYGCAVNIIGATNTSAQQGAIAAFLDLSFVDEYKRIFDKRRKKAFELFNSIPGVSMSMPESSYLSWVDVSKLGTSAEVSKYILDNAQVVVNEGTPYGPGGEGYLRIVHGCYRDETVVETVLRRIRDALLKLSVEKL